MINNIVMRRLGIRRSRGGDAARLIIRSRVAGRRWPVLLHHRHCSSHDNKGIIKGNANNLAFETLAVHADNDTSSTPSSSSSALSRTANTEVAPSISVSTTFEYDLPDGDPQTLPRWWGGSGDDDEEPFTYSRSAMPTRQRCETVLGALEYVITPPFFLIGDEIYR